MLKHECKQAPVANAKALIVQTSPSPGKVPETLSITGQRAFLSPTAAIFWATGKEYKDYKLQGAEFLS